MINAIKQAQANSGVNKVHAVIGGFHLAPYKEDYVRDTVTAIKDMDIDYVIPLHCTGEPFYEMAKAGVYPDVYPMRTASEQILTKLLELLNTSPPQSAMSAFGGKADIDWTCPNVRF